LKALLVVALLFQAPALPPPAGVVPAELKAKTLQLFELKANAPGEVLWDVPEELQSRVVASEKCVVLLAVRPGRYVVRAATAEGGKPALARCVVVVEGAPAPEPDADRLEGALRAAYAAETHPRKAEHLALYAELLREAARADVLDARLATAGQLQAKLHAAAERLIGGGLVALRKVAWAEVLKVLPEESTALDLDRRGQTAALFGRLADLLGKVVKP
jgi:hypothetical protein